MLDQPIAEHANGTQPVSPIKVTSPATVTIPARRLPLILTSPTTIRSRFSLSTLRPDPPTVPLSEPHMILTLSTEWTYVTMVDT